LTSNRFYVERSDIRFPQAVLRGKEHHHLSRVARIRPGHTVWLIDAEGSSYRARVENIQAEFTELTILEAETGSEPKLKIVLAQAVLKMKAMELILQKSTELGISLFVPILSTRTVVKVTDRLEKKRERWSRILKEAAKQSGRSSVPRLREPTTLDTWLQAPGEAHKLVLQEGSEVSMREVVWSGMSERAADHAKTEAVILLVGPEGGWTKDEQKDILKRGYEAVTLGSNILRSETAALTGLAIISHFWNT
jgi:16S rRNA (uracil1498-N3)-methyltransferase